MNLTRLFAPALSPGDHSLREIRRNTFDRMMVVVALLATPFYFLVAYSAARDAQWGGITVISILYVLVLAAALLRKLPYSLRAQVVLSIVFLIGLVRVLQNGLVGDGLLFLLGYPVLVGILLGGRTTWLAGGLSAAALLMTGLGMSAGWINLPAAEVLGSSSQFDAWLLTALLLVVLTLAAGQALSSTFSALDEIIRRQRELRDQLEEERNLLDSRVTERTATLQKQASELEAAGEIARQISGEVSIDELLSHTTELIQTHFGYYHAGIFLMDAKNEYAVLRAASSAGGQLMLQRGHRLRRGAEGIVGFVVERGLPRIALDVGQDAVHFKNPLLPDTRSEMAVPIRAGEQVIGALDVQSTQEAAFTHEDVNVLQTIADQLAVAWVNASRVQKLQDQLNELEQANRQTTAKAWQSHLGVRGQLAYQYRGGALLNSADSSVEIQHTLQSGKPVVQTYTETGSETPVTSVALPIQVRGQLLGVLNIRLNSPGISPEMYGLLEATSERLAAALETARLLEEVQVRAQREHLVGELSSKVRSATDVESILKTTAIELGRTLGLSDVLVQLRPADTDFAS
jgi:GAF domain-containing protein